MKISKVGGIIAAANKKVAMPMFKVGDITIIRRIVITYQKAGIFPIVVITGDDDEELKSQLTGYGVVFIRNTDNEYPELMESVRTGLQFLYQKCERVVFTPVNVPMFTPETLLRLLESDGDIVTPSYEGRGGHPVVLSENVIPPILSYDGENGLRGAIDKCGVGRTWVNVDDKGVVSSIYNEQELRQRLKEYNNSTLHPVLHMRLEKECPFFSERLKLLLFLISDTQNMRIACSLSGIAHSNAWEMINNMEQSLGFRVVQRQRGGKSGGSTKLTPKGEDFLYAYQKFEECVYQFAQKEYKNRFICTKIV